MSEEPRDRQPSWAWFPFGAAVLVALLMRVVDLPLKPLHSDESVNGWYSLRLLWDGYYHYQPSDYHGPLLYYVDLVSFWVLGVSDTSLRLGTALTGVLGVVAIALWRRPLGSAVGVAAAALLLAVQPADVYFARTVIHETYLVTFTLISLGAGLWWLRGGGWGRLALAAAALALMFASKETAIISVGTAGGALALVWLAGPWLRADGDPPWWPEAAGRLGLLRQVGRRWSDVLTAMAVFWIVMVVLFSSFFTYLEGVKGIVTTYGYWFDYGVTGRNQRKEWGYWMEFVPYVWPALVAGLPELAVGLWRRSRATALLGAWFAASLATYALIPYKTPWCALNFTLPLALLAGRGVHRAWSAASSLHRLAGAAVFVAWILLLLPFARASVRQNFERYDDDALPFVYVQTVREFMGLVRVMETLDERGGYDRQLRVVSIDAKNPMRWYLYLDGWNPDNFKYYRGYPRPDSRSWPEWKATADLFVCRGEHAPRLGRELGSGYVQEVFPLRPGHQVVLFVPREMWQDTLAAGVPRN